MSRFSKSKSKKPFNAKRGPLSVEALEDRSLPSANTISGYVFYDANSNGLFDSGEQPIANSQIELHTLAGVVVGTTTTNAQGYYEFTKDQSVPKLDKTLTKTVTFGPTQTNFQLQGLLDQFDPALGQLQSIEIRHDGSITSEIQVENFSQEAGSNISGTVSGTLNLVAPGVDDTLTISGYAGSFQAGVYDGNTDFSGSSGKSFGQQTANGTKTLTLTGAAINDYIGTGQVTVHENAIATSNATGGGNLDVRVRSTGSSTITVIYHYKEFGPLEPGSYKVVQVVQPPGYTDGSESKEGSVIPNTIGTDFIVVGLLDQDLPNNNFAELKLTSISGHVWHDANNNGEREAGEELISGTTITLTGPGGTKTTTTDASGFYEFNDLTPGTYTVTESQPTNYLDGKDKAGTKGGNVVNDAAADQIQTITLQSGDVSENNDFGEIKPSSLAGHVYFDANNNGIFEAGEAPIAGVKITLTGFSDQGPVSKVTTTDAQGAYIFEDLRPGTYALHETQPTNYSDGQDTIGTPGGNTTNDSFDNIQLPVGFDGVDNDFGEIKPSKPGTPGPGSQGLNGILPFISKTQQTTGHNISNIPIALREQMAFAVGAGVTLLGKQLNVLEVYNAVQQFRGGVTRQSFVQTLWASNAHRAMQAEQIYQDILDRAPTAQEKADAVAQLKGGATEMSLRESLYVSAEYQALHATQESLAVALSKDILNVTPGTAETQSLIQAMDTQPLNTVVHNLLLSDDALANQIDKTYRATVRRAATTAEIALWTPQIQAGTLTLDTLAQRLLASQEFSTLAFNRIR